MNISPTRSKDVVANAANGGRFAAPVHAEPLVTLAKPGGLPNGYADVKEFFRGELGHHLSAVVGMARLAAHKGRHRPDLESMMAERIGRAAASIATQMNGDRAPWIVRVLKLRLDPVMKSIRDSSKGDECAEQASIFAQELDAMAEIFHRESAHASPLPVNGLPVLGTPGNGYEDRIDEDGNLVAQVRLDHGKPSDAPDGTPAVITYRPGFTSEKFYTDGRLHDGSGGTPSQRIIHTSGTVSVIRGLIRPHSGHVIEQDSPDGQPAMTTTFARYETTPWHTVRESDVDVQWKVSGRLRDPRPGKPACVITSKDGSVKVLHAPFGSLQDLTDGTPAEQHYGPAGQLTFQARYFNAVLWDADDGRPAYLHWDTDGNLLEELHFLHGQRREGPSSTATRQQEAYWAPSEPLGRYEP
ncbi:hypothetical protein [Arthrobacter sp. A2-55]|uniref:hypothetical protein n=1 Tax=Arthrobacter sp. A2-55 TaxID=2897337 RepID=UPI0021CD64AF|nr:hypothetical protein [Arthrobacter sp. A2-55]MCU6479012.1 hypothetical protein [Arthrobacter sp. A2-55]